ASYTPSCPLSRNKQHRPGPVLLCTATAILSGCTLSRHLKTGPSGSRQPVHLRYSFLLEPFHQRGPGLPLDRVSEAGNFGKGLLAEVGSATLFVCPFLHSLEVLPHFVHICPPQPGNPESSCGRPLPQFQHLRVNHVGWDIQSPHVV